MSLQILIAGVDRTAHINPDTIEITQALGFQEDSCKFAVELGGRPEAFHEVVISEGDHRMFGGDVSRVEDAETPGGELAFEVTCRDYTYMLDRYLVVETYVEKPADEIVKDIVAKYCPGFTVAEVQSGAPTVERITFPYRKPSQCFKELADYVGWQWYVDHHKGVHFFFGFEETAPIEVNDQADVGRPEFTIDKSDFANQIIVQGGKYLSDPVPYEVRTDGVRRLWLLPERPYDLEMTVAGTAVTVGIEGKHKEDAFDYMVKLDDKRPYVRCSSHTGTPADGTVLGFTFKHEIDVITEVNDYESQAMVAAVQGGDGIYQRTITDETLITDQAAEAAGDAELRERANPKISGSFPTYEPGFAPGQIVSFNLVKRGIVGKEYLVNKVVISRKGDRWHYAVHYGGRLMGIEDVLKALVSAQQKRRLVETSVLRKYSFFGDPVVVGDELETRLRVPPWYVEECREVLYDLGTSEEATIGSLLNVTQANPSDRWPYPEISTSEDGEAWTDWRPVGPLERAIEVPYPGFVRVRALGKVRVYNWKKTFAETDAVCGFVEVSA